MNLKHLIGCMLVLVGMISCTQENDLPVDSTGPQTNTVSIQEAQEDLENLLASLENSAVSRGDVQKHRVISDCYTVKTSAGRSRSGETDSLNIHVFNFENKQGYAIMSGVRSLPSLLALSDSGEIKQWQDSENPGLSMFMENLPLTFQPVDNDDVFATGVTSYKEYGSWSTEVYIPNGLCKVKWNQMAPYNNYCPIDEGEVCPTGCVPTAVAQLMSIYKTPGSHKGYIFDWDQMTKYSSAELCSSVAQDNIATLMVKLGEASNLDVDYRFDGSGANPRNIPRTLSAFGYGNGGVFKSYKTDEVVSELLGMHCVLAGGRDELAGGHRWLIHGLMQRTRSVKTYSTNHTLQKHEIESQWLVLCNWGWGGKDDGYYWGEVFSLKSGADYHDDGSVANNHYNNDGFRFNNITVVIGIRK